MHAARALLALFVAMVLMASPSASPAQVFVRITVAPPILPVYVQPAIPGPDYFWAPGYWAWGPDGYYWVPGTWVLAPAPGLLWTPGYWGWSDGVYVWHGGYWGPRIGFYGGINYGYGYTGVGYQGGYWNGRVFMYNTAVINAGNVHITNVYNKTVINNTTVTNVSFNGGRGGVTAQPNAQELAAANDKHTLATGVQAQHEHAASTNHALLASVNHGHPAIAAAAVAGHLSQGVVASKGYHAVATPPGTTKAAVRPGALKQPGLANAAKMPGPGPKGPPRPQVKRPNTPSHNHP
jgi:hypothetical protein